MRLSGHQPNYLPYPGLIGKIMMSDKFIYVTKVQFEKKSWQNRNKIRGANGEIILTVPVLTKGKFDQLICDVEINNNLDWRKKHFSSIVVSYKKAKHYNKYIGFYEDLYKKQWDRLCDLDIYVMNFIINELGINTKILDDRDYEFSGTKTEYLVNMCKQTNCDTYISNKGSQAYVDINVFINSNLNHLFINYIGQEYEQCFRGFIDNMSIVDMLFNCGPERTKQILEDITSYQISEMNALLE
jgi:hypothetical protein